MGFNRLPLEAEEGIEGGGVPPAQDLPPPPPEAQQDSMGAPASPLKAPIGDADKSLQDQQGDAMAKKRQLAMIGGIADALGNGQSFGNFFLGHMNPENHGALKASQAIADTVVDPVEQKEKINAYLKDKYAADKAGRDEQAAKNTDVADFARSAYGDKFKIPEGTTNEAFGRIAPVMYKKAEQDLAAKKADATLAASNARLDVSRQGLGLRNEKFGADITGRINRDPVEMQSKQQFGAIDKARATLNSPTVTNQAAAEVYQDMANIISGGKSAAQGTIHEQSYKNMDSDLAKAKSYLSGEPQNAVNPATRKELLSIFDRLQGSISGIRDKNNELLNKTYGSIQNPSVQSALQAAKDARPSAPPAPAFATDVLDYAKAHNITPEQAQAVKDKRTAK